MLMTSANFLLATGFYFLIPTLPIFAENMLGAKKADIGYIMGVYSLSALLIRPFAGYFLDTVGRKAVYFVGILSFMFVMPTYYFVSSLLGLVFLRFLHGLSWGVITTGGMTIISDIIHPKRRGEGIGYFGLAFTVSMAIGPGVALVIMGENHYARLFLSATALIFFTFIILNFVKYPKIDLGKAPKKMQWSNVLVKDVLPVSSIVLLCTAAYGALMSFITLYAKELGIQGEGWFFVSYAIGMTLIRPIAGVQMDKFGPKRIMIFGFILLAGGLIGMASIWELVGFLVVAFITGVGMGTILPTVMTMALNVVPAQKRGSASSTFFSAVDIGFGLGSILYGILADASSYSMMFYVSGFSIFIPLVLFLTWILKDYHRRCQMGE